MATSGVIWAAVMIMIFSSGVWCEDQNGDE
jgi:hypothetical protein